MHSSYPMTPIHYLTSLQYLTFTSPTPTRIVAMPPLLIARPTCFTRGSKAKNINAMITTRGLKKESPVRNDICTWSRARKLNPLGSDRKNKRHSAGSNRFTERTPPGIEPVSWDRDRLIFGPPISARFNFHGTGRPWETSASAERERIFSAEGRGEDQPWATSYASQEGHRGQRGEREKIWSRQLHIVHSD